MARQIIWTEIAFRDLEAAADFITQDSPAYAAALVGEVREAARALATFADRGRVVPEYGDDSIRELFIGSYRLIYRVDSDRVTILALIHGARDLAGVARPPLT